MSYAVECPNRDTHNCDGEIEFTIESEECDAGDGVYFTTWITYYAVIDDDSSSHVEGCPPLTDEQRRQLELDKTETLDDYYINNFGD